MLLIEPARQAGRDMLKGISEYAKMYGPWTFYRSMPFYQHVWRSKTPEKDWRKLIRQWQPDGIIMEVPPTRSFSTQVLENIPVVFIPTRKPIKGFTNAVDDSGQCGCAGAEHFLDRGFTHLAFCGYSHLYWSEVRAQAFCERAQHAGLYVHVYNPPTEAFRSWEEEKPTVIEWLLGLPKPVGLMACNDDRAQFIFDACKSADLSIPEEIALLGVDNDDLICSFSTPPLSSVALNFQKCGYEMARALRTMMEGDETIKENVAIETQFVETRQSTDILAIDNPDVVCALAYIRQQATNGISTDDVVAQTSISRRMLERSFRQHLGRTIHQEILRVQLRSVEKRLIDTDLPICEIAQTCGFATPEYVGQVFKRHHNMTMLQFRRRKGFSGLE